MKLGGKLCLITGAASGIGRATALAAAERGGRVALTDVDRPGLEAVAAEIERRGGTVAFREALDIADFEAVAGLSRQIGDQLGSVDVAMNIAGISIWGPIDQLEHHHWRRLVEVNLMGSIHVLECFVPPMITAGRGGHVVNVSSAAGLFGLPWHAAYSASKFGIRGVSEVLRFDLEPHGIGVSLVCPGAVRTPLVDTVEIIGADRENPAVQGLKARFERRAVTPEHVAERIIQGVEKDRYMVYTSPDIRVGHWFQRHFPPPYAWAMRLLNRHLRAAAQR